MLHFNNDKNVHRYAVRGEKDRERLREKGREREKDRERQRVKLLS